MRIVVMGAGALGGYYGSFLQRGGHDVLYVARGEHLRAMQTKGLTIRTSDGDTTLTVNATDRAADAGRADLVFLATKAYSNPEAIEAIRPLVGPTCPVLSIQNGVEAVHDLAKAFGPQQVLPGTAVIGGGILEPGLISGPVKPGKITTGEMDGSASERTAAIRGVFTDAGIAMDVRPDVVTFLWQKQLTVGPRSVLVALGRTSVGYFAQAPDALPMYEELMREYMAVAAAEGAHLEESQLQAQIKSASGGTAGPVGGPGQMPSLQRDAENRRWLEVDEMIGSVVRLGAAQGVPTPVARVLTTLLRLQDVTNRDRMAQAK